MNMSRISCDQEGQWVVAVSSLHGYTI